jgi:acyl dehydratase
MINRGPQLMTTENKSFLTEDVKALIGVETEWSAYSEPISPSEVRRFVHAIMDDNPLYYDGAYARATKYREVVCPPLYFAFAFRRAHGTPDPLDRLKTDRDWDAYAGGANRQALPRVPHGFQRMVNGGSEIDLYKRIRPGKRVRTKVRYHDIRERIGRTGPMAIVVTETIFQDDDGDLVARARQTAIFR